MFAENIDKSSAGLSMMSENTGKLSQGNENTSQALNNIGQKLKQELEEMKKSFIWRWDILRRTKANVKWFYYYGRKLR